LADFEFLKRWCNNDWHWCGYTVEIEGFDYPHGSLWGIDSDSMEEFEKDALAEAIAWLEKQLGERDALETAVREMALVE